MHQDSIRDSLVYRIGRGLLPSEVEGLACVSIGILITAAHIILMSLALGTSFPNLLDGDWGLMYTNYIVQPLLSLSNSLVFSNVLNLCLWGLAGLVVYFVFEVIWDFVKDWHAAESNIKMAGSQIIHHPGRRDFLQVLVWRSGVLLITVLVLAAFAGPFVAHGFVHSTQLILGTQPPARVVGQVAVEILSWAVLCHAVVVFCRFFLMRTRLFGDFDIE